MKECVEDTAMMSSTCFDRKSFFLSSLPHPFLLCMSRPSCPLLFTRQTRVRVQAIALLFHEDVRFFASVQVLLCPTASVGGYRETRVTLYKLKVLIYNIFEAQNLFSNQCFYMIFKTWNNKNKINHFITSFRMSRAKFVGVSRRFSPVCGFWFIGGQDDYSPQGLRAPIYSPLYDHIKKAKCSGVPD